MQTPPCPPRVRPPRGFALLEVVVATGILGFAALGIAATLAAAVEQAAAADAGRRATAAAEAAAIEALAGAEVKGSWEELGGGISATAAASGRSAPPCHRRQGASRTALGEWVWTEVVCGPSPASGEPADPDERTAAVRRRVALAVLR